MCTIDPRQLQLPFLEEAPRQPSPYSATGTPRQIAAPRAEELAAKRLKVVTTVLDPTALLDVPVPEDKPQVTLRIRLPDRTVTAEIAAKSLRRVQLAIHEAGADNIVLVLQGRLAAGDVIAEAGLTAQPKVVKQQLR